MVDNRQGGDRRPSRRDDGDARRGQRPQRDRTQAPRRPGSERNGRPPQSRDEASDRPSGPRLPDDVEAKQLSPEVRRELTTLDKATADYVAKHLVMAGDLLDEDPEAALEHARAARNRASRIAAIREAVGIAAYHCGDWAQALSELRAARRMGSKSPLLALIADCERGVGRPERAIELGRSPEAEQLTGDDADELKIVLAGARCDLGQPAQALALLSNPPLDSTRTGQTAARLFYVYAETLLALDRKNDALQWFLHAAAADLEGVTDAEDRVAELG
ncbi:MULTISPECIES: tetratricopeptide repeat protein [Mycolicibacterium]|uniref:tetratricopeptide repeat protein n=1 Tax=Mycolicibacterium TaxID=1866885 RepID=UPI0009271C1F|nr:MULTISPECIES: tetratricopeptide repeat protein [Mycolicibacterium]RUP26786.1 MAG: tetratricopeptide repeat protein [Mycolicibacterium sp.]UCZ58318.1 tetratricopeptide repeat protein [Mycolicibacterium phocaicum]SHV84599.1 TPR repeat-containing protein [Mycobacteroides abscessus subsp. abscessus]